MKIKRNRAGPPRWGIVIANAIDGSVLWAHNDITRKTAVKLAYDYSDEGFRGLLPGEILITIAHSKYIGGTLESVRRIEVLEQRGSTAGSESIEGERS